MSYEGKAIPVEVVGSTYHATGLSLPMYIESISAPLTMSVSAANVSTEVHGFEIAHTGVLKSGGSLVGLNVVETATGTAGSWVSAIYAKTTQASKSVNGYLCAAEFELASTAANSSDLAVLVLNSTNTLTGSPPAAIPYIMLREYGAAGSYGNCFVRIFNDTGQGGTTNATTLITTVSDNYEQNCNYAVRCMLGSTPIWLLATSTAAA